MYKNIVRVSACVTDTGFEVPDKFVVGYALVSKHRTDSHILENQTGDFKN